MQNSTDQSVGTLLHIAVLWAVGSLVANCLAMVSEAPEMAVSQIFLVALLVTWIALAIRQPLFGANSQANQQQSHLLWVCGVLAQINWLGILALRLPSAAAACWLALLMVTVEVWLANRWILAGGLPWLTEALCNIAPLGCPSNTASSDQIGSEGSFQQPSAAEAPVEVTATRIHGPAADQESSASAGLQESQAQENEGCMQGPRCRTTRETIDGIDEDGARFLSGRIVVAMQAGQKSETITIGFCPPLDAIPQLDLESDDEDLRLRVEQASQIGARIGVRRSRANDDQAFELQWFAKAEQAASLAALP